MRHILSVLLLAALLALAGCGAHPATTTTTTRLAPGPASAFFCPPGRSYMGCATQPTLGLAPNTLTGQPAGPLFPDVSSWQGHPDWAAAKPHIAAAVAKLGEGTAEDPDAAYNVSQFKARGIPYLVYWFVRPYGCAAEGQALERDAKGLGVDGVVLDEEVPGIQGYASCLSPYVRAATGRTALVYRSAGNDLDTSAGGLGCWVAAYGPSSTPSCFGRRPLAWQFTDGRFGFPVNVPGIGLGDVSVDYGMFAPAPAPAPACDAFAKTIPARCLNLFPNQRFGPLRLDERGVVATYKYHRKQSVRAHLVYLEGRVAFLATHKLERGRWVKLRTAQWGVNHYGFRWQRLSRDAAGL